MAQITNFFLGANSGSGFQNLFSEIMDPETAFDIMILKGGPGVGKNTFMREIGRTMEQAGADVEYLWCSGDPEAPYYIPKGTDGEPAKFLKAKPRTDLTKCTNCGTCARLCPMGAIDPEDVYSVPGTCIKCQACVRKCTKHAKYFDDPAFLSHVAMLEQTFTEPKKNEVFL